MTTGQDQGSTVGSEISVNAQMTRESLGEIHTPVDQGISLFTVGQPLYLFICDARCTGSVESNSVVLPLDSAVLLALDLQSSPSL